MSPQESQVLRKELGESQDLQEGVLQGQLENQGLPENQENLEMTTLRRELKALLERLGSQVWRSASTYLIISFFIYFNTTSQVHLSRL